jgi:hypothetical protein
MMTFNLGIVANGLFDNLSLTVIVIIISCIVITIVFYKLTKSFYRLSKSHTKARQQYAQESEKNEKDGGLADRFPDISDDDKAKDEYKNPSGGICQDNADENRKESLEEDKEKMDEKLIIILEEIEMKISDIKKDVVTKFEQVISKNEECENKLMGELNKVNAAINSKSEDIISIVNNYDGKVNAALEDAPINQRNLLSSAFEKIASSLCGRQESSAISAPDQFSEVVEEIKKADKVNNKYSFGVASSNNPVDVDEVVISKSPVDGAVSDDPAFSMQTDEALVDDVSTADKLIKDRLPMDEAHLNLEDNLEIELTQADESTISKSSVHETVSGNPSFSIRNEDALIDDPSPTEKQIKVRLPDEESGVTVGDTAEKKYYIS